MSKKKKAGVVSPSVKPQTIKAPVQPVRPAFVERPAPAPVVERPAPTAEPPFALIRFDKRVRRLVATVFGLFLVLTLLKIHYSSIPYWNQVMPDGSDPKRGLIAGKARAIRMDEWAAMIPFELSQINNGYPQENPAIGGGKPGLVVNLPINHFIAAFRPNYWGLYVFDAERGFAWNVLFYPFFGFLVVALLFLLLTNNQFWLSVGGAFWFTVSPAIAWWSFSPLTLVFSGTLILLSSIYIFYARSYRTFLWAGPVFVWSVVMFCLNLYPPYQVPFGYLLIALLIGFVWRNYQKERLFDQVGWKLATFAVAGLAIAGILYSYYVDAKPTVDALAGTVYPGKRSETGGTGFIANWLSEYYAGWLLDDQKFPKEWLSTLR